MGSGFKTPLSLELDPPLKADADFTLEVASASKLRLTLMDGKKWHSGGGGGFLRVKAITVDGKRSSIAEDTGGIRVATVLADPLVYASTDTMLHQTQSKALVIKGSGLGPSPTAGGGVADVQVKLSPTSFGTYAVSQAFDDSIRLLLKEGQEWLPPYMSVDDADKVPIKVMAVDTGAGMVTVGSGGEGIVVAHVISDREGVVCDDSCEFALDGVCDDGSAFSSSSEVPDWASIADDDYSGWYDDETATRGGYYDDYYMDDQFTLSACLPGTDCTDCGGVDASKPSSAWTDDDVPTGSEAQAGDSKGEVTKCTNTCAYARDNVCDDPRGGNYCAMGTDCQDCGPVGASNFTIFEDDAWFDDDDEEWTFSDDAFVDQAKGFDHNRHRVSKPSQEDLDEVAGPAAVFVSVLEGIVYTVGLLIAMGAGWMYYRWSHGLPLPFLRVFSPEAQGYERVGRSDVELAGGAGMRRMPITPDVTRT